MENFSCWLKSELKNLKIDVNIYHSYLIGILEDNIDEDEKREMITDIIGSLVENDTELFIKTLFEKWFDAQAPTAQASKDAPKKQEIVDIAKLLETQAKISQKAHQGREMTEEQRRIKEQILASYSQTEAHEEDDDEEAAALGDGSDDDPDLEKNTNKSDVQKLAREKREQARAESAAKKLKDKEDRAKQKAKAEEKKANRKAAAVKGERRR